MMVALWERQTSGEGQEVNTSLYGSQLTIQGFNITTAMWTGVEPPLRGPEELRPHWRSYTCADGLPIIVGGGTPDRWWKDFCIALGCPEEGDVVYSDCVDDIDWRRRTGERIAAIFRTRPRAEWLALLTPRFLVQPVSSYLEIAQDPQAWANGYLVNVPQTDDGEPLPTVGVPVHLSRTPGSVRQWAPELGQHTEEVLLEAGYSWEDISRLRDLGAFGEISAPAAS